MDSLGVYAWWRQLRYPAAFRIDLGGTMDGLAEFAASRANVRAPEAGANGTGVAESAQPSPPAAADPPVPSAEPETGRAADPEFLLALANEYFVLEKSADRLLNAHGEGREATGVKRAVKRLSDILERHGVEVQNLAGQEYRFERRDFVAVGEPEPREGLTRMEIILCEKPLVRIDGKIAQVAKGIVARPA